ncbi:hypothetical protein Bhyg_02129 [Pseudolycoriella hygida]|uniref:Uncharacterized protein n=1 Tax=Pseudolycoriella hygida TaxID=35572 RepID=A0A9Q0S896_9DIPT|nr:hypothetical protein Bhyg_02129 [Pseudolycoriella hygida]
MKAALVLLFVIVTSAYCRSLPPQPVDLNDESFSGSQTVPLVRKVRQFGGGNGGGYNNFDYNPYNDTPNSYDTNVYNDSTRRILFPFTETRINYEANDYNVPGLFGKK